jgi:UDP-GlcNAc:undecaprenyl-phosphate GlcNAc-1-phosphate transferase
MRTVDWIAPLGALVCSLIVTGVSLPVLRRAQIIDHPNHRSSHSRPVPRGGGLAVLASVCVTSLLAAPTNRELGTLLGAALVLAAVGLADDFRPLSSGIRLLAQLVVGAALSTALIGAGSVSWWLWVALAVGMVGYVNAFNFMDGINGISSLTSIVVGLWWAWAGNQHDQELLHVLGLVLAGAALGFLPWNAPNAKVFLGDVGSYGIGIFVAGLSGLGLTTGLPWHWAVAPLVIYGADTGWVLIKRYRAGKALGEAHREHVYQRLVDGGWSHLSSATACATAGAIICVAVGMTESPLSPWLSVGVIVTIFYLALPSLLSLFHARRSA